MITTLDGQKKKRGETVFEIGVTVGGEYRPTRSVVGSRGNFAVVNEDGCYSTREACQKECDRKNKVNHTTNE